MSMAQPVQPYFDPQGPPQQYILPLPEAQLASGQRQGDYLAGPDPHVPYVPAAGWDYHSVAGMPSGAPGLYPATYGTGYNTFGACDSFPWMCAGVPEETARVAGGGNAVEQESEEPKGRKRKRRAEADPNTAPGQEPKPKPRPRPRPKRKPRLKAKDGQAEKAKSRQELEEEEKKHSSEPYRATLASVQPKPKVLWQRSSVSTSAAGGVSEAGVNSATETETAICDMMDLNLSGVTHVVVKTTRKDQRALISSKDLRYKEEHTLANWDFVRRAVSNALFESEDSLYRITSFVYLHRMKSDEASVILGRTPSDGNYEELPLHKVLLVKPRVASDVVELVCCPLAEEDALKKNLEDILKAVPRIPVEQITKQDVEAWEALDSARKSGDESGSGEPSPLRQWMRSSEKGHEGIVCDDPDIEEDSEDKLMLRPENGNGYSFRRLPFYGKLFLCIPLGNIHVRPIMRARYVRNQEPKRKKKKPKGKEPKGKPPKKPKTS
ncbi:hypothetical protein V2A60_006839 [Cordyceps javanica]